MRIRFSVVIPSYTGQEHIKDCLDSILSQNDLENFVFETLVVIDGPNKKLEEIVDAQRNKYKSAGVTYRVIKLEQNMGRFEARFRGAEEANNPYLLFLDDRNMLAADYFQKVLNSEKQALIPNVLENSHPHFIAKTIYLFRKKIYKNSWGQDFASYEINKGNFEKSPKGTTSFWVSKDIFIKACMHIRKTTTDTRLVSDDTKILRKIVNDYTPIYRSSEAKIYYQPRRSAVAELKHVYKRGPLFIDYYLKPGTRFFRWLMVLVIASLMLVISFVAKPFITALVVLVGLVAVSFTAALLLSAGIREVLQVFIGVPLLIISFSTGIFVGLLKRVGQRIFA